MQFLFSAHTIEADATATILLILLSDFNCAAVVGVIKPQKNTHAEDR